VTSARALLAALPAIAIAVGCAAQPSGPWRKPGTDEQTLVRDAAGCRNAARAEALRRYPYSGGPAGLGAGGAVAVQQRDAADRSTVEAAQFNACMLAKGYSRS
jgi:hypothetical protein